MLPQKTAGLAFYHLKVCVNPLSTDEPWHCRNLIAITNYREESFFAGTLCGESCTIPPLLFDIIFWTGYFNSCLNPFIYATTSREYNRAFRTVLRCHWSLRGSGRADAHNATDYQWSNSKTVTYTIRDSKSPQRQALNPGGPRFSSNRNSIKDVS
ncbi:alpha-1A adrenergic receptor-like [Tropilaelaps mercedesae]|uniref:Alpha-1A adrenergic receptor-like n=1 Tax=Tropilaelaps mercedesae TaxID=418985 RepID=A0A1V9X162_9ACAR|nr:alpha-1A adrenergic receptor-like [Tropilaelaps mercedesae]